MWGPIRKAAGLEEQGLGWKSSFKSGVGRDAITSGLEVTWTTTPTKWSNNFFENLFGFEWELEKSPAGANQWVAKGAQATIPDPADPSKKRLPTMLTTDISLRVDPAYEKISRRFMEHPEELADAFARAWFKLTHRDMGPRARYLGPEVPKEELIWQDPIPARESSAGGCEGRCCAEEQGAGGGSVRCRSWWRRRGRRRRRSVARTSAAGRTGRGFGSRRRRIGKSTSRRSWRRCSRRSKGFRASSTRRAAGGKKVSLADLIVLGGCAGVEQAAKNAGCEVTVPFSPGRMDASAEQTDVEAFEVLEPIADGFRNYLKGKYTIPAEALLVDKAQLLTLTAPEMTVLIGGMRVLGTNAGEDEAWRVHQAARDAHERLLREPLGHGHRVEADVERCRGVRRPRSQVGRTEVDRHAGRSRLRFELAAAGPGRGLRKLRRPAEVRPRLRRGLDQGDEPRSLRLGVSDAGK